MHACSDVFAFLAETFADSFLEKGANPHKLTKDEIAAIYLYTMPWPNATASLYYNLNKALRTADRSAAKPYFPYLRLLLSALKKLPPVVGTVHRGTHQATCPAMYMSFFMYVSL